jgi:amino acid transporter
MDTPGQARDLFLRKASGLVKSAGAWDVFTFNLGLASVGIAVTLAHFWVPANYAGANLPLAEFIAAVFMGSMALTFWCWSAVIPRSGGIYAFLSRGLNPAVGFGVSFVDSFTWLFYNALAATYVTSIGIAPALFSIGILTGNRTFVEWAFVTQRPLVQFAIGAVAILLAGLILARGMRIFFNVQKILFATALAGTAVTCAVLFSTSPQDYQALFERAFEPFAAGAMGTLRASPAASPAFSLKMTVMASVWPLLSFVGTIFSVNIGGEIRNVRRSQAYGMFGSLLVSTALMVALSSLGDRTFGHEFQAAVGRLPAAPADGSLPVAPYFSLLAALAAPHWSLALLICLGFAAWAFFWLPATLVYAARTLLAWSFDRVAPAPLGNVHERWHTPTTALAVVVAANLVFLALYLFTDFFASLVLVLAAMLAWIPTMYAAIVFPYRNRRLFESSAIANLRLAGVPLMSIAGVLGLISVLIVTVMLWNDSVAAGHSLKHLLTIAAVFAAGLLWYGWQRRLRRREGLDLASTFKEIPIE